MPPFAPSPESRSPRRVATLGIILALALLVLPMLASASALAKGGPGGGGGGGNRPEVRVAGSCGRGATSSLRLKARDGAIEAEFEIEHARRSSAWSVVIVQERRIAWRGQARTSLHGGFSLEKRIADYPGSDQISARAVGPRGITCQATAVLPG